jgi:hypothetical protein
MSRKAKTEQPEPLTCPKVVSVATVCCLLILGLGMIAETQRYSPGLLGLIGGGVLIWYLADRGNRETKAAPPLTRGQRVRDILVLVGFESVVGLLIWGLVCHPEWPIWH